MAQHRVDPDANPYAPADQVRKPDVAIEDFLALDMRVGTVVAVDPFPAARKPAWQVHVDFGPVVGVLQTSAQITNYTVAELLGRQVVGAINLGHKRIAGFTSQFLVLGGLEPDGTVRLLTPDTGLPDGAIVA